MPSYQIASEVALDISDAASRFDVAVSPSWNGQAAKWESFRGEIRVWRLGENLNVKKSLAARPENPGCQVLRD